MIYRGRDAGDSNRSLATIGGASGKTGSVNPIFGKTAQLVDRKFRPALKDKIPAEIEILLVVPARI
jgi:hypothetical protein